MVEKEKEQIEKLIESANSHGFEYAGYTQTSKLKVRPEVRDMCRADKCHAYDRSWSCPPACGEIEYFQAEIDKRKHCVVFQSVGQMEDSFDIETMMDTSDLHKERTFKFIKDIHEYVEDPFFLVAGSCTVCEKCSYPDSPCRFPELMFSSMEAAGLVVNEVCTASDIEYNHGNNTISYTSCVLF